MVRLPRAGGGVTTQRHLFTPPAADLSDKQQQVLEILQAHPQGLRSTDIGRQLHMARNAPCACSASTSADSTATCRWAFSDGERLGKQLRRLDPPLAIKRRTGLWELTVAGRPHDVGTFPTDY